MRTKDPERERKARLELYTVSVRAFLRDGYEATSMKSLAEEAGCTTGRFYCYFSGKQEILTKLLSDLFEKNRESAEKLAARRKDAFYGAVVFLDLLYQGAFLHENLRGLYNEAMSLNEGRNVLSDVLKGFFGEDGADGEQALRIDAAVRTVPVFLTDSMSAQREELFLTMLAGILGRSEAEATSYIELIRKDEKSVREKAYEALVKLLEGRRRKM